MTAIPLQMGSRTCLESALTVRAAFGQLIGDIRICTCESRQPKMSIAEGKYRRAILIEK